jgi:hypothetical protein
MSRTWKIVLVILSIVIAIPLAGYFYLTNRDDPFLVVFKENCVVCHGENLVGTPQGTPLIGVDLKHGESVSEIRQSITDGFASSGMPAWSQVLNDAQISSLAIFVAEKRLHFDMGDYKVTTRIAIPDEAFETERHSFRIESFATDLDPLPFSIAPMPEGGFLLTEKTKGLSIISPRRTVSLDRGHADSIWIWAYVR